MTERKPGPYVKRYAHAVADLVREAGHDVFADEVRAWLIEHRGASEGQAYAAGKLAEERGLIVRRPGKVERRVVWGTPDVEQSESEGAA